MAATFGRIDILVNNAAEQYKSSSVEEIDDERLERVMGHGVGTYLGLDEIGSTSLIIIFIIISYLFNHTF